MAGSAYSPGTIVMTSPGCARCSAVRISATLAAVIARADAGAFQNPKSKSAASAARFVIAPICPILPHRRKRGPMDFEFSDTSKRIQAQLKAFIAEHIAPRDSEYRRLVAQGV